MNVPATTERPGADKEKGSKDVIACQEQGRGYLQGALHLHKWALVVLISMGSSIIYAPMYLKNVFYDH